MNYAIRRMRIRLASLILGDVTLSFTVPAATHTIGPKGEVVPITPLVGDAEVTTTWTTGKSLNVR